jgi:hypothetical protein
MDLVKCGRSRPIGQIASDSQKQKIKKNRKYFAFPEMQIRAYFGLSHPAQRGVGQRHNEGWVAVDVKVP